MRHSRLGKVGILLHHFQLHTEWKYHRQESISYSDGLYLLNKGWIGKMFLRSRVRRQFADEIRILEDLSEGKRRSTWNILG